MVVHRQKTHTIESINIKDHVCPAGVCKDLIEFTIDAEKCDGCRRCLVVACPALAIEGSGKEARATVDAALCTGCGFCAAHCDRDAFSPRTGGA